MASRDAKSKTPAKAAAGTAKKTTKKKATTKAAAKAPAKAATSAKAAASKAASKAAPEKAAAPKRKVAAKATEPAPKTPKSAPKRAAAAKEPGAAAAKAPAPTAAPPPAAAPPRDAREERRARLEEKLVQRSAALRERGQDAPRPSPPPPASAPARSSSPPATDNTRQAAAGPRPDLPFNPQNFGGSAPSPGGEAGGEPGGGRRRRRRRRRRGGRGEGGAEGQDWQQQAPEGANSAPQRPHAAPPPPPRDERMASDAPGDDADGGGRRRRRRRRKRRGGGGHPDEGGGQQPQVARHQQPPPPRQPSSPWAEVDESFSGRGRQQQGQGRRRRRGRGGSDGPVPWDPNREAPAINVLPDRDPFSELVSIDPDERIDLETDTDEISMRVVDLVTPIGKGQRGLIVAPPKTGKTTLLLQLARAISLNHPEIELVVMLVDERPEEVTAFRRAGYGEVLASSNDEPTHRHLKLTQHVAEIARRRVLEGKDVCILLDSITRMARAHNVSSAGNKTLSGGLDSRALERPKRFFGAARKIAGGGSLTILATALIDTGSRMDEVIFQEFKGTGNCELQLDRRLAERRIWPAIDIQKSGTRKEEKLFEKDEFEGVIALRRALSGKMPAEAMQMLLQRLGQYKTNREFLLDVARKAAAAL